MPENNNEADTQGCDDSDISVGVLHYTIGHQNRVEGYAVGAYRMLPEAVKIIEGNGFTVPKNVKVCLEDKTYEHDLKVSAGLHDHAKGDWPILLLCGGKRPTTNDWLNYIYVHPEKSAYHIHRKKGLEEILHITERAILMLKCHHMRHDGSNVGYDGENLWYKGEKVKIFRENDMGRHESLFLGSNGVRWHNSEMIVGNERLTRLGYGPMDVYLMEGDKLEFGAEILKVVDAYDAMTSGRKHRKGNKTHDEAIVELISKKGSEFNPLAVIAFSLLQKEVIEKIKKDAA